MGVPVHFHGKYKLPRNPHATSAKKYKMHWNPHTILGQKYKMHWNPHTFLGRKNINGAVKNFLLKNSFPKKEKKNIYIYKSFQHTRASERQDRARQTMRFQKYLFTSTI